MKEKSKSLRTRKRTELVFVICLLAYPIIHKLFFYFGLNIRSIMLAFQKYDTQSKDYVFSGFNNFKQIFADFKSMGSLRTQFQNTATLYFADLLIGIPLSIFSSYFVYKKVPFHGIFKVVFFLPSIVSGVVMTLMFKYFVEYAVPEIYLKMAAKQMPHILTVQKYAFKMMVFYSLWTGFSSGIILYLGSMSRVADGIEDAAKIDGANIMQEFWYVTFPAIYSLLTVFLVTGLVALFTASGAIYVFYGEAAPAYVQTIGYFMFIKVVGQASTVADYPYLAAMGVLITLIATPLTFLLKFFLEKFGPSEE